MNPFTNALAVTFVGTSDRARALSWYRDTLGLEVVRSDTYGEAFAMGNGLLRVTQLPEWQPSPHPVAGWQVPDIAATVAELKARGIAMTRYDGIPTDADGVWTDADTGRKVAWFADPDGNCLALSQV